MTARVKVEGFPGETFAVVSGTVDLISDKGAMLLNWPAVHLYDRPPPSCDHDWRPAQRQAMGRMMPFFYCQECGAEKGPAADLGRIERERR